MTNFWWNTEIWTTDDGSQPLREEADARYIRPCPPQVTVVFPLREHQAVDARYNEGWWQGVISKVLNSREYLVYFKTSKELIMFENSKLRYHQDWLNGEWVIASKHVRSFEMQKSNERAVKSGDIKLKIKETGNRMKVKFCRGLKVEVRSDEEGYQGAWYSAIIIGLIGNDRYLVEYRTLNTDDETEQLKEEADATDIRPFPPDIGHLGLFKLHEIVDAWYNDGWWVGQVSSVLRNMKYMVHFRTTNEYLEFEHHELRPHLAWIQGEWVVS
ncbi:Agenet domain containing protein [Quillaja saponaria]|uniref:Agenet domain containing protein n=1 Tax=Quillaja saponaria TaxID=32244 RepID=A0AAD7QFB8_QUISA|nr:Agenet domain containing protein [Quillaja saponaria]